MANNPGLLAKSGLLPNPGLLAKPGLLVIGANGGIGRQTVQLALAAGYHVTALVRNPANLPLTHPNLLVIKGDVLLPDSYAAHLTDKIAVISALGVKSTKPTTLYSQGNKILLQESKNAGIRRIFFISASGLDVSPLQPFFIRLLTKYVLQKILKNMYADIRIMEEIVKASDADWTIMRPPRLTNGTSTGKYRVAINAYLKRCLTISRADVGHFMLDHLEDEKTFRTTVELAY